MKKIVLFIVLASFAGVGFSATFTISNEGTTFTPNEITINLGDDVNFSLASVHNAREVSLDTWNANSSTALAGGFSVGFGGGLVPASKLTVGIHYYVCVPHASLGMKGKITVLNSTGFADNSKKADISVFPNPSNGNFQLQINSPQSAKKMDLGIYTVKGERVYSKSDIQQQSASDIEVSDLPKGVYILRLYAGKEMYSRKIVVQ